MVLHHISSYSSGIFEQHVSATVDRGGGPTAWRTHSPDISALDFCFWGHLKPTVYATDASVLQTRKQNGFSVVRMTPAITVTDVQRRAQGGCFGHFLHRHEAVTRKPCFRRTFLVLWRRFAFGS
jgi:hypothetical protein